MKRILWGLAPAIALAACALPPRTPTVDDLAGTWVGEWIWKKPEGSSQHSGALTVIVRPIDEKTFNFDITALLSAIPNDRIVLNLDKVSPTALRGEYQGGTMKLVVESQMERARLKVELGHPDMGSVNAEGTLVGDLIRASYSETATNGIGTITLERKP